MKAKLIWEKQNPKQKSKKLSPSENAQAKKQAEKHGRSTPSLVDDINASKGRTGSTKKSGGKQSGGKQSGGKK